MRAVVTRVTSARVTCGEEELASTGKGLLILLGAEEGDGREDIRYIVDKCLNLRIFEDEQGKMNLSLLDVGGEICIVSQFTLLGDCRKGRRPGFTRAGRPEDAKALYDQCVAAFREACQLPIATGRFQAEMQVASVNDGPVTILLDSRKIF